MAEGDLEKVSQLLQKLASNTVSSIRAEIPTDLTRHEGKAISDALVQCSALTSLEIQPKMIRDDVIFGSMELEVCVEGAGAIALALLNRSTPLKKLVLNGRISPEGADVLAKALAISTNLGGLEVKSYLGDDIFKILAKGIAKCPTLKMLACTGGEATMEDVYAIGEVLVGTETLKSLEIEMSDIGDEGAAVIATALMLNSSLQTLHLTNCGIMEHGADSIAAALWVNSTLRHLDLSNMPNQEYEFSENSVRDSGFCDIMEALAGNTGLEEIVLTNCGVYDEFEDPQRIAEAFKSMFERNTTLTALKLDHLQLFLDDEVCEGFSSGLATNSTLLKLDLSSTDLDETHSEEIGQALRLNSTLTHLVISDCERCDCRALAEGLAENCSLLRLDLNSCAYDEGDARVWAEALERNSTLQHLNMSYNPIGDAGAAAIFHAVASRRSVWGLNLSDCNIGVEGCRAIAASLGNSPVLEELSLNHNPFGDEGAMLIIDGLSRSTSLVTLQLRPKMLSQKSSTYRPATMIAVGMAVQSHINLPRFLLLIQGGPAEGGLGSVWAELGLPSQAAGWSDFKILSQCPSLCQSGLFLRGLASHQRPFPSSLGHGLPGSPRVDLTWR